MTTVKVKTFSLSYNPYEDRMQLVMNENEKEEIKFWITRRFYFSLLFELETMLESLQINPPPFRKNSLLPKKHHDRIEEKIPKATGVLLENINIRVLKEKKEFMFLFQANKKEAESTLTQKQFFHLYNMLKSTFPKGEWGFMSYTYS